MEQAMQAVDDSAGLLVVGSSMMVFSGYRFARRANEQSKPVVVINRGRTRVDEFARFKIEGDIAGILTAVRERL